MSAATQATTQPAITHDPLVLDPTVRILGILRGKLHQIQGSLLTSDHDAGELVAECIQVVDDAFIGEVRRANDPNSDLSVALRASTRLTALEKDVRAIEEHLGILAIGGKIKENGK